MFKDQEKKKYMNNKTKIIHTPRSVSKGYFFSKDQRNKTHFQSKNLKENFQSKNSNDNFQCSKILDVKDMKLKINSYFQKELKMVNLYRESLNGESSKTQHQELTVNYDFLITRINKQREKLYQKISIENYMFKEFLFLSNFYKSKIFEMNTYIFKLLDRKIDVSVGKESEVISFMDSLHQKERIRTIQNGLIGKIDKMEEYRKQISRSIGDIRGKKNASILMKITKKRQKRAAKKRPKIELLGGGAQYKTEHKPERKRRIKRFITFTKKTNQGENENENEDCDKETIKDYSSSSSENLENDEISAKEFKAKKKSLPTESTEADFILSRSRQSLPKLPSLKSKSSFTLTPIISPKFSKGSSGFNRDISKTNIRRGENKKYSVKVPKILIEDSNEIIDFGNEGEEYMKDSERAKRKIQSYYNMRSFKQ